MGQIGCFSFYPTKNLGGFGDGGMITTNDAVLAEKLRLLTNHGMQPRYYHQIVGINSRLDAIQAAILSIKLKHVDRFNAGRSANARSYSQLVQASGLQNQIKLPFEDPRCHHVWNQLTVRIVGGARDQIRESLAERGIGTEVYYPVPMHEQACFRYLGFGSGSLPETEQAAREVLSLPIFPELTEFEINQVVKNLGELVLGRQPYRMAS